MRSASARWRCRDYIGELPRPRDRPIEIADVEVDTKGPAGRYGGVLYIEKEGFDPIIEAAGIPERFDIAPMSCKGMSVTAGRMLVEELCGRLGLKPYILHDFDISGFSIKKTLVTSNRRYKFKRKIDAIDLGLRLADIEWFAANGTPLPIRAGQLRQGEQGRAAQAPAHQRRDRTEIEFLLTGEGNTGQRVELNAMTSDQFVAFVERKLTEHGAAKVVPSAETLAETYAAFKRGAMAQAGARSRTGAAQRRNRSTYPPTLSSGCAPISTSIPKRRGTPPSGLFRPRTMTAAMTEPTTTKTKRRISDGNGNARLAPTTL